MRWSGFFVVGIILLAAVGLQAQEISTVEAQKAFALAVAKAHSESSPFVSGMNPFVMRAKAQSRLALHGTGTGTYVDERVDAHHWRHTLHFADFDYLEMRNGDDRAWSQWSEKIMPLRVAQFLRFVAIHVPNSAQASGYLVRQSLEISESGEPLACYDVDQPRYEHTLQWCFDRDTGLLHSENLALDLHIVFGNYHAFQGKQVYSEVHVRAGKLPVLDIEISYAPLDAHALDNVVPAVGMVKKDSTKENHDPDEWQTGTLEYQPTAVLPQGADEAAGKLPARMRFLVDEDGVTRDIAVEQAPTEAMAQVALKTAQSFVLTPRKLDGKPVLSTYYELVWFKPAAVPGGSKEEVYRSGTPPFVFRYSGGFEAVSDGQLGEDRRRRTGDALQTEKLLDNSCSRPVMKAQRLAPGGSPEVLTVLDVAPACVYGVLDDRAMKTMATDAAKSVINRWNDGAISIERRYSIGDRAYYLVSASGIPPATSGRRWYYESVVADIRGHAIGWTVVSPVDDGFAVLKAATLEVAGERETRLVPDGVLPEH